MTSEFPTLDPINLRLPYSVIVHRPDPNADYYEAYKNIGRKYTLLKAYDLASPVLQSAIDALTNGGRIFIKKGIYDISGIITFKDNIEITGELPLLRFTSERCFYSKDVSDITIERLRIHHVNPENYLDVGTSSAILIEAVNSVNKNIKIRFCEISNCLRAGIQISIGLTENASGTYGFRDILIENNYVYDLVTGDSGIDGNGILLGRGYMQKVRIRNNRVENMLSVGILAGSDVDYGLFKDVKIEQNHIKSARYYGIDLSGIYDSEIVGNYIYNEDGIITSATYGIFIETASIQPSERVKIEKNTIDGAGLYGIYIYSNVNKCEINRNVIRRIKNPTETGARHIIATGLNHKIVGNLIDGSEDGSSVVGISAGNYSTIAFNQIFNITDHAIQEVSKTGLTITENYIENPTHSGIDLANVENSIITENYVKNVPSGYYGIYERGTSNYNIIMGNNLLECAAGRRISYVGANTTVKDNQGYITENGGTATIPNGQTSVTFAHGLAGTPTIVVLGAKHSEVADAYVSAKDATNITITVPNAVSADREISWYAEYKP